MRHRTDNPEQRAWDIVEGYSKKVHASEFWQTLEQFPIVLREMRELKADEDLQMRRADT